jgi:uncharacterized membrane protein YraQ (UPF0718 family)
VNGLFNDTLYALTAVLLIISFIKDRKKTKMALLKGWKSLENILPQFLSILIIIGIMLAVLTPAFISRYMGQQSGWWGMLIASIIGATAMIPAFIAFPLTAALLKNGAGLMQIAVFVSTLMMVSVVTLPVEIRYFGKKATYLRNSLAYLFSFVVAIVIGVVLR